jgi:hypothetical protein
MGVFANVGVSVGVEDTLPRGRGYMYAITDEISSWSHVSAANGGYLNASCTIIGTQNFIDEWLEAGLGRWITLYDEGTNICWRGFVDTIAANIGGLQITRGPMSGIANRAKMVYSTVDTSTTPPTMGVRATTTITNDTASQAIYGIWQKTLSCGGTTAAGAAQLQALYLAENATPQTVKTLTPSGGNLSMTLTLKGAWYWLAGYEANFTTTGTVNLSTRLTAILGMNPNTLFSTDYSNVTANTYQVGAYSNDDKNGMKALSELIPFGDVTLNRYTAGFYGQEVFYYAPMPSALEYTFSLSDPAQEVQYLSGVTVRPWAVLPARWMQISDLMVGRVPDVDFRDDPRNLAIEQVTYTAPYGLQVNGAKVGTLSQVMARMGLSGIGGG